MEQLRLSSRRLPAGIVIIVVAGDLDLTVAGRLEAFIRESRRHPGDHLVFDLAEMTFMDSAGLRVLLNAYTYGRRHGGAVHLAAAQPRPAVVLAITQVGSYLGVHETVESALHAALTGSSPEGDLGIAGGGDADATA
ncbi:STAS domain-containing protein [Actinomadura scrupuli]|uniref:STAS domain-containing protein n=1 Tax=Actinomadura scrupuli TaxID=559629 RepID=UPI003D97A722